MRSNKGLRAHSSGGFKVPTFQSSVLCHFACLLRKIHNVLVKECLTIFQCVNKDICAFSELFKFLKPLKEEMTTDTIQSISSSWP